jgi:hypothetical protein
MIGKTTLADRVRTPRVPAGALLTCTINTVESGTSIIVR